MLAKSFRDLHVWQKGIELTVISYEIANNFTQDEKYGLSSQLKRAAVSIPANIAEGFGRWGAGEFAHFLRISLGSLFEIQTHIEIAHKLKYIPDNTYNSLNEELFSLEKMLNSFIKKCMDKKNKT